MLQFLGQTILDVRAEECSSFSNSLYGKSKGEGKGGGRGEKPWMTNYWNLSHEQLFTGHYYLLTVSISTETVLSMLVDHPTTTEKGRKVIPSNIDCK